MNDERQGQTGLTFMTCPDIEGLSGEDLLLYLVGRAPVGERTALEAHLRACDTCVGDLSRLQRRLSVADEVPHRVPAAVREAADRALAPALRVPPVAARSAAETRPGILAGFRAWLDRVLDLRVLVPVSVAAGALVMVGVQEMWVRPAMRGERMRAIEVHQELRITAPQAIVRARPSAEAGSTATLARGALVRVAGEERGWFWVVLPDGKSGWVERRAFE